MAMVSKFKTDKPKDRKRTANAKRRTIEYKAARRQKGRLSCR